MEQFLSSIYNDNSIPVWSAIALGFMTALSPCPLATNITAMGFISRNLENRNRVFYNGLIYTLGRAFSYTLLAVVLFAGADRFRISGFFQKNGEKMLGPFLIVIGLFMLGVFKLNFPSFNNLTKRFQNKHRRTYWDAFLLGVLFALAFCPYSGVLYFGMLIPMTISSTFGLYLPVVFALATGVPVIIFAWLLAYTVSGVGKFYNRLTVFEIWFRSLVAVLFIGIGIYVILRPLI